MKLGFLVNPVAGMGGKVGLKGTDGVYGLAVEMGAEPVAAGRGLVFLQKLKELGLANTMSLVTCPGEMGENEVRSVGLDSSVLPIEIGTQTTAEDTKRAVKLMAKREVDLVLFVGGDGTARDVLEASTSSASTLFLGVPSGVKMYSGIFAVNTQDAAFIVEAFLKGETKVKSFEIVDADEAEIRNDRFNIRLHGFLKGPYLPMRIQGSKQVSPESLDELENQKAVARFIVEEMIPDATYILCPGTSVKCVADLLGVDKTLLGVDVYHNRGIVRDVSEKRVLQEVDDWKKTWIVVSPIGRQGILFGRGNQQVTPRIIRFVGKEKILVLATEGKIRSIEGNVLRVDTGDGEVDKMLAGYIRVATDYREWRLLQVK